VSESIERIGGEIPLRDQRRRKKQKNQRNQSNNMRGCRRRCQFAARMGTRIPLVSPG
jgi:hypothetical protein